MYILNSFTEVDILCFGCMELKKTYFDVHKKVKIPFCYFEKSLNTPLSFTMKKVLAPLHSAPAPLYSKFFKPPKSLKPQKIITIGLITFDMVTYYPEAVLIVSTFLTRLDGCSHNNEFHGVENDIFSKCFIL